MEIFYRENAFHAGKKIRKIDFAPLKYFPVTPLNTEVLWRGYRGYYTLHCDEKEILSSLHYTKSGVILGKTPTFC